ncbi:MAG: DUF1292 domain-containing protein [Christensenellales bacterium]|jgi:uncharacterized protein YrzB (UPF0473 family)
MSDNLNNNQELSVEVVTFQDDDGNEFDMEIVDEFEHAGRKFAVLAEILEDACGDEACAACCGCEDDDEEEALYIFEVINGENGEEFVPVEDDNLLDELSTVVENLLFAED